MVLTVPQLQQAVFTHGPITAGRRTIQTHTTGLQVTHPHQISRQFLLECSPALIVAQVPQDVSQSVINQIVYLQPDITTVSQCFQATFRSRLDAIHPMVGLREHMRQPNRGHNTQAQPCAVAVRREVLVQ
jgi:hypothetical protein